MGLLDKILYNLVNPPEIRRLREFLSEMAVKADQIRSRGSIPVALSDIDGTQIDVRAGSAVAIRQAGETVIERHPETKEALDPVLQRTGLQLKGYWDVKDALKRLNINVTLGMRDELDNAFRTRFFDPEFRARNMPPLPHAVGFMKFFHRVLGVPIEFITLRNRSLDIFSSDGVPTSATRVVLQEGWVDGMDAITYAEKMIDLGADRPVEPSKSVMISASLARSGAEPLAYFENDPGQIGEIAKLGVRTVFVNGDVPPYSPSIGEVKASLSPKVGASILLTDPQSLAKTFKPPFLLPRTADLETRFLDGLHVGPIDGLGSFTANASGFLLSLVAFAMFDTTKGDLNFSPLEMNALALGSMHTMGSVGSAVAGAMAVSAGNEVTAIPLGKYILISENPLLGGLKGFATNFFNFTGLANGISGMFIGTEVASLAGLGNFGQLTGGLVSAYGIPKLASLLGASEVLAAVLAPAGLFMLGNSITSMVYESEMCTNNGWSDLIRQTAIKELGWSDRLMNLGIYVSAPWSFGAVHIFGLEPEKSVCYWYMQEKENRIRRKMAEIDARYRKDPLLMPLEVQAAMIGASENMPWFLKILYGDDITSDKLLTVLLTFEKGGNFGFLRELAGNKLVSSRISDVLLQMERTDLKKKEKSLFAALFAMSIDDINRATNAASDPLFSGYKHFQIGWKDVEDHAQKIGLNVPAEMKEMWPEKVWESSDDGWGWY